MKENKDPAINKQDLENISKMFNSKNQIQEINEQEDTKTIDEITKKWGMNDKLIQLFADKVEGEKGLKSKYAIILIATVIVQLALLNVWFALKGFGIIDFSDKTFNLFLTGGLLEVFALVRIIVKYLFSDNLSELLKILVRTNNNSSTNRKNNKNQKD